MAWCVAFSPDGKTLGAGLEAGEVRLFDVDTTGAIPGRFGWQLATLSGLGPRVRWLGFHPDGRSLVVAGALTDHTVFVWDLATRKQPRRLPGHRSEVLTGGPPDTAANVPWLCGIALSPEGRHLAVCNPNGTVYVLRLAQPGEVFEVPAEGKK